MSIILTAEAAAAFDELTRSNRDTLLVRQHRYAWPNTFRTARYITAVEYIQANRIRHDLIEDYHRRMKDFDVVVTPSFVGGNQLLATNLTGHPVVVVPNGFKEYGSPTSISFLGNLFDEGTILAVAAAYQEATAFNKKMPRALFGIRPTRQAEDYVFFVSEDQFFFHQIPDKFLKGIIQVFSALDPGGLGNFSPEVSRRLILLHQAGQNVNIQGRKIQELNIAGIGRPEYQAR